ncbi:hypothetical protein [Brachybacterium sp. AOP3-A1-3]|uniref:hypothetical protein n=1 Tax=Brachybacterium sp. AOP3-A1-3 TaxID=3457699 RepID=UPI004033378C
MQQPIQRSDVYEPKLSAVVGGMDVDASSLSLDRELSDSLPGAGRFTAATGELTATVGDDVSQVVSTPWDAGTTWPPAPESPVAIGIDMGAGMVPVLANGRATALSGGTDSRATHMSIADQYQSLDRMISWDALAGAMPSEADGAIARYVGLQSSAVTDMILRHCGWYATPPAISFPALSVPAMGTMWPERGYCVSSIKLSDPTGNPDWVREPWGVGVKDVTARYKMAVDYSVKDRGRIELMAYLGQATGDGMYMEASSSAGAFRLVWRDSEVAISVTYPSGNLVTVASLPRMRGALAIASIEYVSDTTVLVWLSVDGSSTSKAVTIDPSLVTTPVTDATITGRAVGSGFQIGFPPSRGRWQGWKPNAVIHVRGSSRNSLRVLPGVIGENCADLLQAQCAAEAATYWIDEAGVLQWWDLAQLEARDTVATLTSAEDITDSGFTWSHDLSSVKSQAVVKWREPLLEWSTRDAVDLWQGGGKTYSPSDPATEEWINVPDDEVWLLPDLFFERVGSAGSNNFNLGIGSWYGGVNPGQGASADTWATPEIAANLSIERVGRNFKLVTSWSGSQPMVASTLGDDAASWLWMRRRNFDLPILRGKGKFTFGDQITNSDQKGPSAAPEHEIDAGWWIQRESQARYTADYVAARITVPQPVFSSISIVPVPGLQLGDTVTVDDTHVTRLTIRGLIVQDSRTMSATGAGLDVTHSIALRPTAISYNGMTWQTWGSVMSEANTTWDDWGSSHRSVQWTQWASGPLGGNHG